MRRGALPGWPRDNRGAGWWLAASGLLCLAGYLLTIPFPRADGHLVASDGHYYFAILRSVVVDHDLDFANDYALLGESRATPTATGLVGCPYAVGSALLWIPFFGAAHLVSLLLVTMGWQVPLNGVSHIYEGAAGVGTIVYVTCGFGLTYAVIRRLCGVTAALVATLAAWWATSAFFYIVAEPSMSHGPAIFAEALFLWLWYPPTGRRSTVRWGVLGLAVSLVALVRWQEGLIVLLPAAELLAALARRTRSFGDTLRDGAAFAIGVLVGFAPQWLMWWIVYGSPLLIPQGSNYMQWMHPHPWLILFSTRHGLMTWHPVNALAAIGLIALWHRDRALTLAIASMFVLQVYVNGAVLPWWADDAFGGRHFIGLLPMLTVPLAVLMEATWPHRSRRWPIAIVLLVLWNGLCFMQYRLHFVGRSDALTWQQMTVDRLLVPWQVLQRVLRGEGITGT